jgi:hypothetical protein
LLKHGQYAGTIHLTDAEGVADGRKKVLEAQDSPGIVLRQTR